MKIISKLNIKIDVDSAKAYYLELEKNFQHMKWEASIGDVTIHAWSIHGIKGRTGLVPFFEEDSEPPGIEHYYKTELAFGWAKEMLDLFPYGYRAGIGSNPPGTVIHPHCDPTAPHMVRLHIPIITNKDYTWTTAEGTVHLEEGSAYIIDTSYEHATINAGTEARVHFALCIPRNKLDELKKFF